MATPFFSENVKALAKQFAIDGSNDFALHDALIEDGFPSVAEHFDQGEKHYGYYTDSYCNVAATIAAGRIDEVFGSLISEGATERIFGDQKGT